jgi:hypothetical protein
MGKVLVLCETSGTVRRAFERCGHQAISVDLLPSDDGGRHIQIDINALDNRWISKFDLVIAHPPCTYFSQAGLHWMLKDPTRLGKQLESLKFFKRVVDLDVPRIAVENLYPSELRYIYKRPTQIIQPWMFGHEFTKSTGLWLRNLPPLKQRLMAPNKTVRCFTESGISNTGLKGPKWKRRSKTFSGIARAMATQWGPLLPTCGTTSCTHDGTKHRNKFRLLVCDDCQEYVI